MTPNTIVGLFTRDELQNCAHYLPGWAQTAYQGFVSIVERENPQFPCFYGTHAHRIGDLRFSFVPDGYDVRPLANALLAFVDIAKTAPRKPAMVAFVRPSAESPTLETYKSQFWTLLQLLHDSDTTPWPANVPIDPESPKWAFCFAGCPLFINAHSPLHVQRRSRSSTGGLMLIVQPMSNLVDLFSSDEGLRGRIHIREALASYDSVPIARAFGTAEAPGAIDWRQYWLPDGDEEQANERFPLHLRRKEALEK